MLHFLGRLHPLILHLPIGILVLAYLMVWLNRKEKPAKFQAAIGFSLQLSFWSALAAAISGWLLSDEGGYDENILFWHQWLGVFTVFGTGLIYFLFKKENSKFFFPSFTILIILLFATGHFGGSLTHGSDFLSAPFSNKNEAKKTEITNLDSALVYQDFIQPIFKKKCVSCHNASKKKGELLMTSIADIEKGGESGDFLKKGSAEQSLFLQRVHLPKEDKKHMPPKGKKQLTDDEIFLLGWWVNSGASFENKVSEIEQPENIKAILAKYVTPENNIISLNIPPVSETDLQELENQGIGISLLSNSKNHLNINLRGRKDLNNQTFKLLKNVAEQIVELDLSNSNFNDDLVHHLEDFPHLQKLFLQKTQLTGKNFETLTNLEYLEYLNLYETPLKYSAIPFISKIKTLKKLFFWQTNIPENEIAKLQNDRPNLQIQTGIDREIFGTAQLKPPLITADKDIFKDSLLVSFEYNFKNINLFYTLNGTPPDSNAQKYYEPFYLKQTADIQAIAVKKGWQISDIAQKTIARVKFEPTNIKLSKPPHENYKADGAKTLINFKKGTEVFAEGGWLGYQGEHFSAILDLGKIESISKVIVGTLEDTNSWIFLPKGLEISVSENGREFKKVTKKEIPTTQKPSPAFVKNFILNFEQQTARFVKVEVKSNLKNPAWHPNPGGACWVFVDEILVE